MSSHLNRLVKPRGRARTSAAATIRQRIVEGVYPPGSQLPNRLTLIHDLGASANSVQAAMDQLVAEGFLENRARVGTFVSARPPHTHVYALSLTPSQSGRNLFSDTRFVAMLRDMALTMVLPGGGVFRIYEGVDDTTLDESYQHLRLDISNRAVAGVIVDNPWFIRNLVADSPVPWVIASTLENVPRQAQALEFSHAQWISRVADHLVARGRKRVACVFNAGLKIAPTDLLANILRSRGLEVPRAMTQGMTPGARAWTSRIVELQFTAPAGQRPDALVIADDILLDDALSGLINAGLSPQDDLEIVSLANFPSPAPALFPVTRIGVDLRQFLLTAAALIDRARAGKPGPAVTSLPPLFEHELSESASLPVSTSALVPMSSRI